MNVRKPYYQLSPTEQQLLRAEVLESAGTVLLIPDFHCKGMYARDENTVPVTSDSLAACRFCAVGSIRAAVRAMEVGDGDSLLAVHTLATVEAVLPEESLAKFNDLLETTNEDVAFLFLETAEKIRTGLEAGETA